MILLSVFVLSFWCYIQEKVGEVDVWQRQIVFADIMKRSFNEWWYSNPDDWSEAVQNINVSSISWIEDWRGYPSEVPIINATNTTGHLYARLLPFVMTYVEQGNNYYHGEYKVVLSGIGRIHLSVGTRGYSETFDSPGTYSFEVPDPANEPEEDGFYIRIDESDPNDPINSIKIIIPNHSEEDLFNKEFISLFSDFYAARTVRMTKSYYDYPTMTNYFVNWEDRTRTDARSQVSDFGMAYEYMIDLINELDINLWLCVPHLCSDDCMTQMATLLEERMNPHLKVFLEFSNEVWNPDFYPNHYCSESPLWSGYHECYANRSANMFSIFDSVFGLETEANSRRLVRILCGQRAGPYHLETIVSYFNSNPYVIENDIHFDAFCVDGYMAGMVADGDGWDYFSEGGRDPEVISQFVDESIEFEFTDSFGFQTHLELAQTCDVRLFAYEAGQHLVTFDHRDNEEYWTFLNSVQRLPSMGDNFRRLFDVYFGMNDRDPLFILFTSIDGEYPQGSIGLMLNMSDTQSPKWVASKELVREFSTCYGILFDDKGNVCNGNGNCVLYNNCTCSGGYFGLNCSKWSCDGVENSENGACNDRGICYDLNLCECFVENSIPPFCNCQEGYVIEEEGDLCVEEMILYSSSHSIFNQKNWVLTFFSQL